MLESSGFSCFMTFNVTEGMKHCGEAPSFRCTVALSVQKPNPCLLVFLFFNV